MSDTTATWTSPLLDLLFEERGVGRCLVAPDGSVLRANAEWLRSTGFSLDEVVGVDISDLFPETRDMALAMHARVQSGHHVEVPRHVQTLRGHETWWEGSIDPVPMAGGTGLLIAAREVSRALVEARDGEQSARLALAEAIEGLPDGFVALDREWRFTFLNHRAAANVGRVPGELLGRNLWELYPSLLGTEQEAAFRKVMAERTPTFLETKGTLTDRWYRQRIAPTSGGIIVVWTDITDARRAELALAERESELGAILNAVDESIWLFTVEGVALAGNRTALARWGGSPDSIIGKRLLDLLPAELARERLARLEEAATTGRLVRFEDSRAGIRFEHSFYPVLDAAGRARRIAVFSRDITERVRGEEALRQRETQLRTLIENVDAGVALIDEAGRFVRYNRRFLGLFGLAPESTLASLNDADWGRWQVVDAEERPLGVDDHPVRRAGRTGQPVRNQLVGMRCPGAGELVWMLVSAEGIATPLGLQIICTYQDVTSMRRADQAVREADRRKSQFLAVLSHELRNPLAPIRNSLFLLDRVPAGSDAARGAREVLHRQTEHLTRLVNDLLDVSRITYGKIELQLSRIDVREMVRRACDDLSAAYEQRGVDLRYSLPSEPLWVEADEARLAQMIGNLLHNALKFTRPGGHVRVVVERRGEACEVAVRDDGIGVEPGDLPSLFEPFVQSGRTRHGAQSGLGIGLSVVRELAGLHRGSVRATSAGHDQGAEFVISLPLAAPPAGPGRPPEVGQRPSRLSILIVEDNADAGASLAEVLALDDHQITVVGTGRLGVEAVSACAPDVLICDLGLPDMSGYDVIRTVRALAAGQEVFAIALTGYAQPEDRQLALAGGFDAHLAKPASLGELQGLLASAAARKG